MRRRQPRAGFYRAPLSPRRGSGREAAGVTLAGGLLQVTLERIEDTRIQRAVPGGFYSFAA